MEDNLNIAEENIIEWYRDKAKPIEKATGAKLYGFDPGFSFHWEQTVIDLPTSFVIKLGAYLNEMH